MKSYVCVTELDESMEAPSNRKYNLRSASSDGDEDHALSLDDLNSSADSKDSRNRHHSTFSSSPSTERFVLQSRQVRPCMTMLIQQRMRRSVWLIFSIR